VQYPGEELTIEAHQVVNATGAYAGVVAGLAGAAIDIIYSKGSLLVTHNRITDRVVNRLRSSASADILVPGGTVSILGTTSIRIDDLDQIYPTVEEHMINYQAALNAARKNALAFLPYIERGRNELLRYSKLNMVRI
jgi:glycerol-3-phosphate dehydrogenase